MMNSNCGVCSLCLLWQTTSTRRSGRVVPPRTKVLRITLIKSNSILSRRQFVLAKPLYTSQDVTTCHRVVNNLCYDEFVNFGKVVNVTARCERRAIAHMRFIAHLFLRQIIELRVVTSVMTTLFRGVVNSVTLRLQAASSYTYRINCLLALLFECGSALEGDLQKSGDDTIMDGIISQLSSLLDAESLLEKRTRSDIAKLLVLRRKGWKQKIAKRGDAGDVVYVEEVVGARPESVCGSPARKSSVEEVVGARAEY